MHEILFNWFDWRRTKVTTQYWNWNWERKRVDRGKNRHTIQMETNKRTILYRNVSNQLKINDLPGFEIVLRSFDKQQFGQKVYEHFFHPWRHSVRLWRAKMNVEYNHSDTNAAASINTYNSTHPKRFSVHFCNDGIQNRDIQDRNINLTLLK